MLMEQLDYNFLFRWFVGLNIDDPVWEMRVQRGLSNLHALTVWSIFDGP